MSRLPAFVQRLSLLLVLPVLVAGCNSGEAPPKQAASETGSKASEAPAPPADSAADSPDVKSSVPTADSPALAPAESPDNGIKQTAAQQVPPGVDPLIPAGVSRPTTEGWWRIVFAVDSQQDYPQDYSAGFIRIGKTSDGKFQVEEVKTNQIISPAVPVKKEATEKTVDIAFAHEEVRFSYSGELSGNVIRGNLQFESPRQNLVRLVPVEAAEVTEKALDRQRISATFGSEEIVAALQSDSPVEKLRETAKTWADSPVVFMGYDAIFQAASGLNIDRPTLDAMAKEFEAFGLRWGERARQAARLNIAANLLLSGYETDLAEQNLELVKKEAPELAGHWEQLIKLVRARGEIAKASRARKAALGEALDQIKQGQTEAGLATLRKLHSEQPIDPVVAYRLAVAEQAHGSKEEALRLFSRLAALPQVTEELGEVAAEPDFTPPRVIAARLFEEQKGSRDGFDDFLKEVYHEGITSFLTEEERDRQPIATPRTTLVELFTGATCPPCVAADVATEALERSFPLTEVTVLRYHVHNPGPDPLTSPDSVARYEFYGSLIQGTPTVLIDGAPTGFNVGGPFSNSPVVFRDLAAAVTEVIGNKATATVDLEASVTDNVLQIRASASDSERSPDSLRLRVVIAENRVSFDAPNGIREHAMVVREMPGGAAGIAAVEGKFAFEQELPVADLRQRLLDYLDATEKELSMEFGQRFTFDVRPVDLRRLVVVAFLQDDATREVLATKAVPIEQEISLPALSESSKPATPEPATGPALAPAN